MRDDYLENSFEPLVGLLQQELGRARLTEPGPMPASVAEFTRWYLAVVQLLEAHVAAGGEHDPMTRSEVELLCRCALSGADLAQCIDLCRRFSEMLTPRAGRIVLETAGASARFVLDTQRAHPCAASNLADISGLFAFSQLLQWLVGRDLPLERVSIGPLPRDDVLPFLKLFRAPVLAGGDHYALEFRREALAWPNVRVAGEFEGFFEVFPCGVFETTFTDLPHQVSALLHAAVHQGQRIPSQQQLARTLDIPLTTLRRRLALAGRPFRQLREECLRESATQLLQRGDLGVAEIAQRLGFSDAGAFRRAFQRWMGMSPSAYSALIQHGVPRS
jgi:AraC-like DNA-binding protein